jgi:cyclopropane-fatty-acyl-phospholipid synthase
MAYAFDHGWLSVAQVLSFKPSSGGEVRRPWTREYQYRNSLPPGDRPVEFAGKLDWT